MKNNVDSKKKLLFGKEKVPGGANDESTEQKGMMGDSTQFDRSKSR